MVRPAVQTVKRHQDNRAHLEVTGGNCLQVITEPVMSTMEKTSGSWVCDIDTDEADT